MPTRVDHPGRDASAHPDCLIRKRGARTSPGGNRLSGGTWRTRGGLRRLHLLERLRDAGRSRDDFAGRPADLVAQLPERRRQPDDGGLRVIRGLLDPCVPTRHHVGELAEGWDDDVVELVPRNRQPARELVEGREEILKRRAKFFRVPSHRGDRDHHPAERLRGQVHHGGQELLLILDGLDLLRMHAVDLRQRLHGLPALEVVADGFHHCPVHHVDGVHDATPNAVVGLPQLPVRLGHRFRRLDAFLPLAIGFRDFFCRRALHLSSLLGFLGGFPQRVGVGDDALFVGVDPNRQQFVALAVLNFDLDQRLLVIGERVRGIADLLQRRDESVVLPTGFLERRPPVLHPLSALGDLLER